MRSLLVKVTETVTNALAYIRKDTNDYYRFGDNDKLPNRIIATVNYSGTGRSCVTKITSFTKADGFIDTTIGKSMANPHQTFNSFLSDIALNVSYLPCVSFRVLFDVTGNPARVYPVPTQQLRRVGLEWFSFNRLMGEPDWNKSFDKKLKRFDITEPPAERLARVNEQVEKYGEQIGDIVYHFNKGIGLNYDVYPIPDYYSGIEDVESDSALQRLEKRNITKGFRTPVIVSTGPIDNISKDENNMTDKDHFNKNMASFAGEDAAFALHLEGATNEVKPVVTTIPIADILDAVDKSRDRVGRTVCRHMSVPPVLVGFATAGKLGDNQELSNSIKLFNMTIFSYQNLISQALNIVFPDKDFKISTLKLFDFVPDSIIALLTEEEKRAMYELPPKPVVTTPANAPA